MVNSNPLHLLYVLFLTLHALGTLFVDSQIGEMSRVGVSIAHAVASDLKV